MSVQIGFKEVGKEIIFKEIVGDYDSISSLLGGLIEYVPSGINGLDIIINEEGKLNGMMPNLYYGDSDVLCGNVIFIRHDEFGNSASITKEDIEILKKAIPRITIPERESKILLDNIDKFFNFSIDIVDFE